MYIKGGKRVTLTLTLTLTLTQRLTGVCVGVLWPEALWGQARPVLRPTAHRASGRRK